jgi:hypothetical protein
MITIAMLVDADCMVDVAGTVARFRFRNPHGVIRQDVVCRELCRALIS